MLYAALQTVASPKYKETYTNCMVIQWPPDLRDWWGLLNRGTTVDVGAGKAARENATGNKIYEDEGKLVREGKDGIDRLLEDTVNVPAEDLVGSIWQIKGFSGVFSSVHLIDPLADGAVAQCKIYIPRDIYALGPFIDSLANLISMVVSTF
ncbi:hypothetical protein G6F42_019625 [Rhizopus arrhizus]|nr:hypothetical protein G6F42_019625 [Rhizopus arrhizus]